jgi:hypothetical protein
MGLERLFGLPSPSQTFYIPSATCGQAFKMMFYETWPRVDISQNEIQGLNQNDEDNDKYSESTAFSKNDDQDLTNQV